LKGVILAGGLGTRLYPLTKITNKHLLPLYDKPMIYYPLITMVIAGIKDVMIITGGSNAGDFIRLLQNGQEFDLLRLHYAYQEKEGGIAHALSIAENFVDNDKMLVILGDNILEDDISDAVSDFESQKGGAKIFLKEVGSPKDYGVAEIKDNRIVGIEEKPAHPKSKLAVIGVYMYDASVFDIIRKIKPSARGEMEITDVNNWYIQEGNLTYHILDGWWGDAGASVDTLLETNNFIARKIKNAGSNHWWNWSAWKNSH